MKRAIGLGPACAGPIVELGLRLGLVLVLALVWAIGCTTPLDPPPEGSAEGGGPPHRGGELRLAYSTDPNTLDPALGYDEVSWLFEQMQFDTLVDYDAGTAIVPELASAWEISADGRTYTFPLRSDVRFSTGRPFTASDMKYSLERVLTPALHSQGAEFFAGIAGAEAFVAGRAPEVTGIVAAAPDRLTVTLREPDPLFLHKLTMPFAAAVDRETVERVGQGGFARAPVGTGAFRLVEWVLGQRLRLERNPYYTRGGLPYLDGIVSTIGVSPQLAWFQFQRGALDLADIPSAEFRRVAADARWAPLLVRQATLRTQYLGMNCGVPPFDQPALRRAVNLAIDRARLLELVDGRGVVARGILPPDMPGADPTRGGWAHDPAAARRLLAEAGLAGGVQATLWTQRDDRAGAILRMAQSLQLDLAAVGIALTIKPVDFPALIEAVRYPGRVAVFLLGWEADFPDPSNFLSVLLHSRAHGTNNNTFYANAAVDALLDEADAVADPGRRMRLFQQAETQILYDAPWAPLYHPVAYVVRHPRVRGFAAHPVRPARFESVWLAW